MKKIIYLLVIGCIGLTACSDLDLVPLAQGSSENWNTSETEIEMSLNDLYKMSFWTIDSKKWTDDYTYRETNQAIVDGTLNGQDASVTSLWSNQYKCIARANTVINKIKEGETEGVSQEKLDLLLAEAYFHRAAAYSKLACKFGDVPLVTDVLDIETAFTYGRTPLSDVKALIYEDFDKAAAVLPAVYKGKQRASKGAALALKARFALYMSDYDIAATAAKAVIDSKAYTLHTDFADLFLTKTHNAEESIFVIPRSIENDVYLNPSVVKNAITRNTGGWTAEDPSWDLLAAYTCTDGKPIDESPLFDSHEPFKNRDPRLSETIVPFNSQWLGFDYTPHPEALEVMNYNTGNLQKNNDTRANAQYASFNGLAWKKGIDETWLENGMKVAPDLIYIRYAEVLLIYAEAKIELNQIDASVLNSMNQVRARAYGVSVDATDQYPSFTTMDQTELRKQLRVERRMEFAEEGLRYMDLVRWHQAEISLTRKSYGLIYPSSLLIEKVTSQGDWFWSKAPNIDENGLPDFSNLEAAGKVAVLSERHWDNRQYLWPIPTSEILINTNMKQNDGY
ncbi:MAG: RagB/SusD family nutrient uptake outer membrane protein [Bacteroidaceae bacterium]|nr:RagB/SusD family nutrient uptake outer membrane protein [Bacteroidaceae bacterium]